MAQRRQWHNARAAAVVADNVLIRHDNTRLLMHIKA